MRTGFVALSMLLSAAVSHAATTLPRPSAVVTDEPGVLTAADRQVLTRKLTALANAKLATGIVYIAASLPPGEEMEPLTLRSVNEWKVGHAGGNDGLVIFIFMKQRKIRIEVGRGLESVISNAEAKRIIDGQITPAFRKQAYGAGLIAAVDALSALLHRRPAHALRS